MNLKTKPILFAAIGALISTTVFTSAGPTVSSGNTSSPVAECQSNLDELNRLKRELRELEAKLAAYPSIEELEQQLENLYSYCSDNEDFVGDPQNQEALASCRAQIDRLVEWINNYHERKRELESKIDQLKRRIRAAEKEYLLCFIEGLNIGF